MRRFLIALLIVPVTFSCITESETTSEAAYSESDVYIELLSEFKAFERSYGNCLNDTTGSCTTISITYPYFSGTLNPDAENVINEKITSMLIDNMMYDSADYTDYENFSEVFFADFKDLKSEFEEAIGWQYEANVSIMRNDSVDLTLRFENYLYTGGAHGMYMVRYLNINPETGHAYDMSDIFRDAYTESLNARIKNAFLKKLGLTNDEDLSNAGYWFENEKYFNENVAVLADSLIFYYNQYEIAPYAMGPTRLSIPVQSVNDLLNTPFKK